MPAIAPSSMRTERRNCSPPCTMMADGERQLIGSVGGSWAGCGPRCVVEGFLVRGTCAQHGVAPDPVGVSIWILRQSRLKHLGQADSMSSPVSASITANFRKSYRS